MKNLLSFITAIMLLTSVPAKAQIKDATEQNKRLARTQFHVTKTFKGEVVKMLYQSPNSYGGTLNGFVFRRADDKLLLVDVPTNFGHEIGPIISNAREIEVTVTGDELLLEEIFYKKLSLKRLEVKLQERISGLADIASVKSNKGSFSIQNRPEAKSPRYQYATDEAILNAKVLKKIGLEDKEGILVLENGDSLIFYKSGGLQDYWDLAYVSYLRPKGRNPYAFYRNPQVFSMNARFSPPRYSIITGLPDKQNIDSNTAHPFLQASNGQFESFISDPAGYVQGLTLKNKKDEIDTFLFNRSNAAAFQEMLKSTNDESITIHFQRFPSMNFLRAVTFKGQTITGENRKPFVGQKDDYMTEKVSFAGKVSEIQYLPEKTIAWSGEKQLTPFRNIVVDDSVFIRVNEDVALSIAKQLELGKEISFDGWRRKEKPNEINQKGYTYMIPHKIRIDGITFTNNSMISNSI